MKLRSLLIILVCFLTFSVGGVLAVLYLPNGSIPEQASNGYATPQTSNKDIILADASCKKITSTTNTQYFIPTSTMAESDAFIANPPAGVSVGSCTPAVSCGWNLDGPMRLPKTLPGCSSVHYGSCTTANSGAQIDCMDEGMGICDATHCSDGFRNTCECSASAPNSCSLSLPSCGGSSCILTTGVPTSANQAWSTTGTSCKIECTSGYTGNDCLTPPVGGVCGPAPACIAAGNCTVTANAPTSANQAWSNGGAQCGYTCSGGWSGTNCDVAPAVCFDARQYSAGRHCDIGGEGWWWIDARTGRRDTSPYLFGRPGYAGFVEFDSNGLWFMNTTTNYDAALCKNGASPIQSGDYGYSCPEGSTAYGGGCYYPNTDARRPIECDSADPNDECCFFICPAAPSCTAGTCGSANGTTVTAYSSGAQLCTSGNIQNIDNIAADGIYNWSCGSTSCSANRDNTTGPFCNGIAKPTVNGGAGPQCIRGTRRCELGSAGWQCGGTGWVWHIQNHVCVGANQACE